MITQRTIAAIKRDLEIYEKVDCPKEGMPQSLEGLRKNIEFLEEGLRYLAVTLRPVAILHESFKSDNSEK